MELAQIIITIASVITALGVILGVVFSIYRWYLKTKNKKTQLKK